MRLADLPSTYRTLVGIAYPGLVLGLVLSVLGVWQEMAATQGNECAPYFNEHHLAPLSLSVLILGWLGLICAIAGAAAAYQLNSGVRRLAEQMSRPTTGFWKVVLAGGVIVGILGGISVVLIYQPFFFRVPVCALSMPVGL
ncbi:MAG TPA: hypothetical protein VGN81_38205 [Pseudonocardiaceae bacterium]